MPELPEVETTKASLQPLIGSSVTAIEVRFPRLRYPLPTDLDSLIGYQLSSIERRAKYLLLSFTEPAYHTAKTLLIHLGMSGSLQQYPLDECQARKHDHLLMHFKKADVQMVVLHYHDPRRFGFILWADNDDYIDAPEARQKFLSHLGPEPLTDDFSSDYLSRLIHRIDAHGEHNLAKKPITKPIKTLIMEQAVVVGVGNIYATESLFLAGIHPQMPAHQVSDDKLASLVAHIKTVLAHAISQGGSSLKDFTVGEGKTGYFQQTLLAYGRAGESCTVCGSLLENLKIGGRASVYCPSCQPA